MIVNIILFSLRDYKQIFKTLNLNVYLIQKQIKIIPNSFIAPPLKY